MMQHYSSLDPAALTSRKGREKWGTPIICGAEKQAARTRAPLINRG